MALLLLLVAILASPPDAARPALLPDSAEVARATGPDFTVGVTAAQLRAYCAAHPDLSPRRAAEDLLAFELLAREAEARGLGDDPGVRRETARAAVPIVLKKDFESKHGPEAVPESWLRRAYDTNISMFKHPEIRRGDHILVAASGWRRPADPIADAVARQLAEEIRQDLGAHPAADAEAFRERAVRFKAAAEAAGLSIKAEEIPLFSRVGRLDEDFSREFFLLGAPGELTPAFPTRFGYHIGRLAEIVPPVNRDFDAAVPELRARLLGDYRRGELARWTTERAAALGVAVDPSPLAPREASP